MQAVQYKIEEIIEKAENLSYMPTIVLRLMEMTSDPDVAVHEIVAVVKKDQGMVARVFKVANSSFYGRLKKAENLTDSIITLGLRGLKSLVIAQAVKHVLLTAGMDDHSQWEHAVKVSIAATVLAKEFRCEIIEDAIVSGLVHDIGKAFIGSVYTDIPLLIHQKVAQEHTTYEEAERAILDFDHSEIGAMVTERWGFPEKIVDVIRCHHSANDSKKLPVESQKMVDIIKLANILSKQSTEVTDSDVDNVFESISLAGGFDLTRERLAYLMEEVKTKWKTETELNMFY